MKAHLNLKRIGIFWVLFFLMYTGFSQTYKDNNQTSTDPNPVNGKIQVTPEVLTALGIGTMPNPRNATIEGNQIFLKQIGDYNQVEVTTNTNASEINLLQNGSSNYTSLNYTANTAIADILQNGDFNQLRDYVNRPTADISLDLKQEGSYLYFEREGVNELTKSIQFRQSESTPDLIIRSIF